MTSLQRGNQRFVTGVPAGETRMLQKERAELVQGQAPFAAVLGCSDSRVPVELVFDQGLGDLFVVRVAGNIATPTQIGSLEFAAEKFGTRLVVVMGHTGCGAVQETLALWNQSGADAGENLGSIVESIRPSVEALLAENAQKDPGRLMEEAVRANVRAAVARIKTASPSLAHLARTDGLRIAGAVYSLETGRVEFLDE